MIYFKGNSHFFWQSVSFFAQPIIAEIEQYGIGMVSIPVIGITIPSAISCRRFRLCNSIANHLKDDLPACPPATKCHQGKN
ncbi:MAG: hypothetical protein ACLRJV_19545 [Eubacteriales bacterium]